MIDDNPAIHEDYRKILAGRGAQMSAAEAALFGERAVVGIASDIRCGLGDAGTGGRRVGATRAR